MATEPGDITQKIQEAAARDPQFRRDLVANPRATLERVTGGKLPADVEFKVLEATESTQYIVLPPAEEESMELQTSELSAVAGGRCPWCFWTKGTYCFWTK